MSDKPRNLPDLKKLDLGESDLQPSQQPSRERNLQAVPRYSRRLSDKILIAFHHACDQSDYQIAEQLLLVLENLVTRRPVIADGNRRRNMESLVAAHERLWHLRHRTEIPS